MDAGDAAPELLQDGMRNKIRTSSVLGRPQIVIACACTVDNAGDADPELLQGEFRCAEHV